MANLQVSGIIEKMTGKDKDFRYMATSDLLNELNKESFKLDTDLEMRLSSIILKQLDDVAGDVSGLAVKCLAPLVKKVGEERIVEITNKLCEKLLHGKDQHRDTASIALRTVVAQVAPTLAPSILVTLTPQMIGGISGEGMSSGIKCECLEIMCDVVQKYGSLMADDHNKLLNALLLQLGCNQATVRKKTVTCIASLASSLSDDLLAKATVQVVKNLSNKNAKSEITRTNIQMIGALSRSVGYRFGTHLGNTVPVLIKYCTSASENDEELREYSLQALESFLLRCPRDISPYCDEILNLTLEYISYDPNFTDNMEEDTDDETVEDEEDDESANEYTDDEDASWKVRRAAAKCLAGLIVSRSEMISKVYQEACPKLIDRFKEREENVKMDVFNTFIDLLRQTGNVTKGQTDTDESSAKWLLKQEVSKIVKSINRQLREKSVKTKVGAFSVLRELVVVLPDCLADHIGSLVPGIERALNDKSSTSNLKIEALVFTKLVLASHAPPVFHPYIKALSSPVLAAVGERYYKVTAEALRVCGELVRVVRPSTQGMGFDFKPFVHPIYNAIMSRLTNQDQDQEVKECAITCMGLVISTFGDQLGAELPSCLPVLVDRMGNEITRLTAVKAFAVIATSPLHIDLSCVLDHLIAELTGFLRKANRVLRQATLITMNTLVTAYGDKIDSDAYEVIVVELSSLICVSDLHMTALALELCCTLMTGKSCSENISLAVRNKVLPQALTLVKSPLLQGQALLALQGFFEALVYHANTSFYTLLDSLLSCAKPSPQSGGVPKQALYSIAQCVAVLCLAAGDKNCSSTVKMLIEILKDDSGTNSAKQHLALLSLGEIGRRKDLSAHAGIETIVIESFQSPFEEIKSAASYALGNIAVGNLSNYLPFILNQIDNQQKKQYILLHSLKEVIVRQSVDKADFQNSSVEKILALLFNHCESEEEGVRNVVAECLGKMALIEPEKLVPALKVRTTSPAAFTRATVVTAVKYSVVERPEKLDEIIFPEISSFLMLIKDGDRHVRRAAVSALSTFAHYKPNLIKGLLSELLPLLYDQTVIKKELIRTVDLGPFKHVVDDGLELRKAAFECVFTLLDSCLDQLNPSSFIIPFLKSGLEDHYDLKMICHLILSYGRTPNPDVLCNTRIKFGAFMDAISGMEYDYIASGHYAKVVHPPADQTDSSSVLELSQDMVKDQTYFLSHLSQTQLKRLLFPLGCVKKEEVRKLATEFDLPNKDRKDSQGICFLGKIKFSDFVGRHIGEMEGIILEAETGDFLGNHRGFWFYTIGQRQGLRLPGGPWYVVEKDTKNNVVFVSRNYYSMDKRRRVFRVGSLRWLSGKPSGNVNQLRCKVRHGPGFYSCRFEMEGDDAVVHLDEDDQGLAAGQFAAFYEGTTCIGSGVILESWDDQCFPVCAKALELAAFEDNQTRETC